MKQSMKRSKKTSLVTYHNFDIKNFSNDILIIVPAVFYNFKDICKNYFLSLKKFNLDKIVLFCSNDIKLIEFFKEENISCCYIIVTSPKYKTRLEWLEVERFLKAYMLYFIMKNIKCNFISSDADIYFHKNPLPYLRRTMKKHNLDILTITDKRYINAVHYKLHKNIIPTDQDKYGTLNGAFCLWKNRNLFKIAFKNVLKTLDNYPKLTEAGAAQTIFNEYLKKLIKAKKVKIKELHSHLFVNGFTLHYADKKYLTKKYLTHFNFVSRDPENIEVEIQNKIKLLKQHNMWII